MRLLPFESTRSTRTIAASIAVLVAAGAAAAVLWLQQPAAPPSSLKAADYSGRPTACLATDIQPSNASTAAGAWSTMQAAAAGKPVNLQRLAIPATSPDQAATYLKGLAAQHCTLIVTVGTPGAAIPALVSAHTGIQFISIDSTSDAHDPKVTALTAATYTSALSDRVSHLAPGA